MKNNYNFKFLKEKYFNHIFEMRMQFLLMQDEIN